MSEIARIREQAAAIHRNADAIAKRLLDLPQVDCPVVHRFGPGIYIREVTMPAGTFAIGHVHRTEHLNMMLAGRVTVLREDGSTDELIAPLCFVGQPGRKIGYVHETVVWQNIFATAETDVEKLEEALLDKSAAWLDHERARFSAFETRLHREDYRLALEELGVLHLVAKAQSENAGDLVPFPHGSYKVRVAASPIEGQGLFATAPIEANEIIAPARIAGRRTPAGRFTNHAATPNAAMIGRVDGDIDLVATRAIRGMTGGELGEEITVDYRQAFREARRLACRP